MKKKEEFEDVIPQTNGIYFKLHKAKQQMGKVSKNAKNPHFRNSYADINALIEAVEPILLEYNLLLLQPIVKDHVSTVIMDVETGESVSSSMILPNIADPQKVGSAVTYFRRYTLQSLLSLQALDDDGNTASEGVKNTKPAITEERFKAGLDKVDKNEMSKAEFINALSKFELSESQKNVISLL